jgi:sugar phosphate permease
MFLIIFPRPKEGEKALVSLAGVAFLIAGVIITAIALYAVLSTHWAWGVPFVFIGVMCLIIGLVIPLLQ